MPTITQKFLLFFSLVLFGSYTLAAEKIIIAPHCLLKKLNQKSYNVLSKNATLSIIQLDEASKQQLIIAKNNQKTVCGGFIDVTDEWQFFIDAHLKPDANRFLSNYTPRHHGKRNEENVNYKIQYRSEVEQLLKQLNPQRMWNNLSILTEFHNRYANSQEGVAAANWFAAQIKKIAAENNREDVTLYTVKTGEYFKQPSVVAKIGEGNGPGIVISAHLDTLRGRMPGADDDGSGAVTILETAQTLLSSKTTFKKPIYFIWYAAEEEGLYGSQHVVREFIRNKTPVDAVLHFDLTGYAHRNESTMWLIEDNVDEALTQYLSQLITTYTQRTVKYTACGYACSDHYTWTQHGFRAAIPAEAKYEDTNPSIHSSEDIMDHLSLTHMTDYAKLATAFAVEMAEPIN